MPRGALSGRCRSGSVAVAAAHSPSPNTPPLPLVPLRRSSSAVRAGSGAAAAPTELTPREHAKHSAAVATPPAVEAARADNRQPEIAAKSGGTGYDWAHQWYPVCPATGRLMLMLFTWQESFPCPLLERLESCPGMQQVAALVCPPCPLLYVPLSSTPLRVRTSGSGCALVLCR